MDKHSSNKEGKPPHTPVLLRELIDNSLTEAGDLFIDCTFGGGSHTRLLLEKMPQSGLVIAIDRDLQALDQGYKNFADDIEQKRLILLHSNFADIAVVLASYLKERSIGAIIADLGVSSMQIDEAERGFSFRFDGPLDMRMDQTLPVSAADVVNNYSASELAKIFSEYGEEPKAFAIAKKIERFREEKPFTRTEELAKLVEKVWYNPRQKSRKHPATRVFQALRMFVNDELKSIEKLVDQGFKVMPVGARMGIISFHSLEDRKIKHAFLKLSGRQKSTPFQGQKVPFTSEPVASKVVLLTPSPIQPTDAEILSNPRARSAKLRVIEKL